MLADALTTSSFLVAVVIAVIAQLFRKGQTHAHLPLKTRQSRAVLVTGASRGIGKTTAAHLSFVGYTIFGSVRSQDSYDGLLKSNDDTTAQGTIIPIKFDVTNEKEIAAAVELIQKKCREKNLEFVGIVNNAGINPEGERYAKMQFEEQKLPDNVLVDGKTALQVLDTNVVGCFRVTKAFLPLVSKENGRIILIGSYFGTIAGALGLPHLAYEASKFALEALADGLRRGLKGDSDCKKIKVSLIKPGNIQTDMNQFAGESPPVTVSSDVLAALEAKRPSARYYPGMVKGLPCKNICDFFALLPSFITDTQL
ncbi:short chain dehydrogenase/reductase family oxidoreductase [Nitzschia inconspicua]|uniref:Short chain dehydrogenase/reductase family oxidoreductase n=1 Tax=Nitzschia inconspicua TaxID=303405 RepID=A0A9K3K5X0_9STRA|nr:short chain dehydrogenase/reductase family oxidoreductase [Nitzschia inconspicua]KAG7343846.1 short chain dehydrogenase/reductase family oxidoreductase [Nitzschia inconspicua]